MATQNQIDANLRSSQQSTGPQTPEGRAAVRLNGIRHGLAASDLVFPGESEADFENLFDSIEAEHQPTTPTEVAIVRRIAMATWRLHRSYRVEAGFYTIRRIDMKDQLRRDYKNLESGDNLAVIVRSDSIGANTLDNISRYEGRYERSLDKALHELQRLRSATCKRMQNQSQSAPQPPEPDPPADPPILSRDSNGAVLRPASTQPVSAATPKNQQLALGNRPRLSYTLITFLRRDSNETTRPGWRRLFGFGRHHALGRR